MKAAELKVYEILKNRFNEAEAEIILEYIEAKSDEKISDKKDIFLVKQDKIDLIEKMNKDKIDLIKWMFGFWVTIILLLLANWFLKWFVFFRGFQNLFNLSPFTLNNFLLHKPFVKFPDFLLCYSLKKHWSE